MKTIELKDGSQLLIRKANISDAEEVLSHLKVVGDESPFLSFSSDEVTWGVEEEIEIINKHNYSENQLFVLAFVGKQLVAVANVHSTYKRRGRHMGEMGISILKDYWSKGIASKVIQYMLDWSKENPFIEKIMLHVLDTNVKAIGLYEKFGFEREGFLKKASIVDGKYHDLIIMSKFIQ